MSNLKYNFMKTQSFYILNEDYKGFEKGTILLQGAEADPHITDETGIEYFDVSTEVNTGCSYSVYGVPLNLLTPSGNDVELSNGFNSFFNNNYLATDDLKELFKQREG